MERKEATHSEDPLYGASSSSTSKGNDHEVFLSFRGIDTRKGFADYLYTSLVDAGIRVFRDNNELRVGEEIGPNLHWIITQSKISIPIISENYAFSKWCLRELAFMLKCKRSRGQIVLPIFYKVELSELRHLTGRFKDAINVHKRFSDDMVLEEWKEALKEVSTLKGWESEKIENGHEGILVKMVVEKVSQLTKRSNLTVPAHLVGIDKPVEHIMSLIDAKFDDTSIVGIYGMGGIGKTVLARVLYKVLSSHFENLSYLADIRETSQRKDIRCLQKQLISDILRISFDISNVQEGIDIIKSRFTSKKVLVLLDDVDDITQLRALCVDSSWFEAGSIVIITTRNKSILDKAKVGYMYKLRELSSDQSLILFSRHAFEMDYPQTGYENISRDIVRTTHGLPLALEVIGSLLRGKTKVFWEEALNKLKEVPHKEVQAKLKISYEALDHRNQQIFLDVACFFIGSSKQSPTYMWDSCGFFPSEGIEVLSLMSLIEVDKDGKLMMHDQMRNFAREIVYLENPKKPQERSRLWDHEDAIYVLDNNKGTSKIKALRLDEYSCRSFKSEQFKELTNLRFLQVNGVNFTGDFQNLLPQLRWLQWQACPSDFVAANFHPKELVVLNLSWSEISEDWGGWGPLKMAIALRVLNLSHCHSLRRTPNLSAFKRLKILILEDCDNLEGIHSSIGDIKTLVSLNVKRCRRLEELPVGIGKMEDLRELILDETAIQEIPISRGGLMKLETLRASFCARLAQLSECIGSLTSLTQLDLSHSGIKELPESIGFLKKLTTLDASYCASLAWIPSSIGHLASLQHLLLRECCSLTEIPDSIEWLESLIQLDLKSTAIVELPQNIRNLQKLRILDIDGTGILDIDGTGMTKLPGAIAMMAKLQELRWPHIDKSLEKMKDEAIQRAADMENSDRNYAIATVQSGVGIDDCVKEITDSPEMEVKVNNLSVNILPVTFNQSLGRSYYSLDDLPRNVVITLNQGSLVKSMDFHPVQQILLLVGTNMGDVMVWEVGSGARIALRNFKVWDLGTCSLALQASLANDYTASVNRVMWSPDGKLFGVAYSKHIVHIYSYHGRDNMRNHLELEAHVGSVNDLAFSYPNKRLCVVTCGEDMSIKVWDTMTGAKQYCFKGHEAPVYSICPHQKKNIQFIFSTTTDGKIQAWLYDDMGSRVDCDAPGHASTVLAYSADGTRLFSCGTNKEGWSYLVEWNESEGVVKRMYHGLGKRSGGVVQFDTTKNRFLAVGDEFMVKFWDMDNDNLLTGISADGGLPASPCIKFNKEGILLAVSTSDNRIKVLANADGIRLLRTADNWPFDASRITPGPLMKDTESMANVKPGIANKSGDKSRNWKVIEIDEPLQCRSIRLPDNSTATRSIENIKPEAGRQPVDMGTSDTSYAFSSVQKLVRIDDRAKQMIDLLEMEVNDEVRIIGIYGTDGIGKTTLAKAVYDNISSYFDSCSFLVEVDETTQNSRDIRFLQSKLIRDILALDREDPSSDERIEIFVDIFRKMKVLIVVDGVEKQSHLHAIVGDQLHWFGLGSRIIVTSQNEEILKEYDPEKTRTYMVSELDDGQAFELFCKHAFTMSSQYDGLADRIVNATEKLPLAVEVVGSFLRGRSIQEWEKMEKLMKLFSLSSQKTTVGLEEILDICYKELDQQQKNIFLDIACFISDADAQIASYMWPDCYLPSCGCILMPLAKIGENNELQMHRLLRCLGKRIIEQEGSGDPSSRRFCTQDMVLEAMNREKGIENVEARDSFILTATNFASMPAISFLKLDDAKVSGDFTGAFQSLRWLCWQRCPLEFDVINFVLRELVILDLSWSKVTEDWRGWSEIKMEKLKVLNLTGCSDLLITPNFSDYKDLEILILERCSRLVKLDPSIGNLKHLVCLNLKFCSQLNWLPAELGCTTALKELFIDGTCVRQIPISIGNLKQLEILSGFQCFPLTYLPSSICYLISLSELSLDGAKISELPSSLGKLLELRRLSLRDCRYLENLPYSIGEMGSLEELDISATSISELPDSIRNLKSLKVLRMDSSFIRAFPGEIGNLTKLEELHASWCQSLKGAIPRDIKRLCHLRSLTLGHTSISSIPLEISTISSLQTLDLLQCNEIEVLPELPPSLICLHVSSKRMKDIPLLKDLKELEELYLSDEDPEERQPPSKQLKPESKVKQLSIWFSRLWNLELLQTQRIEKQSFSIVFPKLRKLELSLSRIIKLEFLYEPTDIPQLKTLTLSGLSLEEVSELPKTLSVLSIRGCSSLKRLPIVQSLINISAFELYHSAIEEIEGLEGLKSLKRLQISNCKIQHLNGIVQLTSLRSLIVSDCDYLDSLPNLSNLKLLKVLEIRQCKMIHQIEGLEELKYLEKLKISECPAENSAQIQNVLELVMARSVVA